MSVQTIRQSTLNMLFRCGMQCKYRFEDGIIIPPGVAARRGTTVHTTSQATNEYKLLKGVDLPVDYMQDLAADTYRRLVLDRGVYIPKSEYAERHRLIGEGMDSAVRLSKLYRTEIAPSLKPWLIERTVVVDFGLELPLEGTIDLVESDSHLRDIKSAGKSYNQAAADCSLQLTQYNVMFYLTYGYWPPETSLIVLVDLKKEQKVQVIKTRRTEACLGAYKQRVALAIKQFKSGIFLPTNPDNWWCTEKWCGYWQMCPFAGGKI